MVEDDPPLRRLNKILLEETGKVTIVGEAEDGLQAIAMAKKLRPDVILLDLAMPVMGGVDALPKLRGVAPQARIIVLSMLQRDGVEAETRRLGAGAFIDKGLDSTLLVDRLLAAFRDARPCGELVAAEAPRRRTKDVSSTRPSG